MGKELKKKKRNWSTARLGLKAQSMRDDTDSVIHPSRPQIPCNTSSIFFSRSSFGTDNNRDIHSSHLGQYRLKTPIWCRKHTHFTRLQTRVLDLLQEKGTLLVSLWITGFARWEKNRSPKAPPPRQMATSRRSAWTVRWKDLLRPSKRRIPWTTYGLPNLRLSKRRCKRTSSARAWQTDQNTCRRFIRTWLERFMWINLLLRRC